MTAITRSARNAANYLALPSGGCALISGALFAFS